MPASYPARGGKPICRPHLCRTSGPVPLWAHSSSRFVSLESHEHHSVAKPQGGHKERDLHYLTKEPVTDNWQLLWLRNADARTHVGSSVLTSTFLPAAINASLFLLYLAWARASPQRREGRTTRLPGSDLEYAYAARCDAILCCVVIHPCASSSSLSSPANPDAAAASRRDHLS